MTSLKPKFRIVYVENSSKNSSNTPLFTGSYASLAEIKERLEHFIPTHPSLTIEYYNKKFGIVNRRQIEDGDLPSDLECIYIYLRSKTPMTCHVCTAEK